MAIFGIIIVVPYPSVESLQLIWRSDTRRFHLRVYDLRLSCRLDYMTGYQDNSPKMPAKGHAVLFDLRTTPYVNWKAATAVSQNSLPPTPPILHDCDILPGPFSDVMIVCQKHQWFKQCLSNLIGTKPYHMWFVALKTIKSRDSLPHAHPHPMSGLYIFAFSCE